MRPSKKGGRGTRRSFWQRATYLLHLVERRLVDAELLEVIVRRLDHPLDDLLVDQALMSRLACCRNRTPPHVQWAY
jgi:hypothetical protein